MVDTKVQAHPTDDKNPLFEGDLSLRDGNIICIVIDGVLLNL